MRDEPERDVWEVVSINFPVAGIRFLDILLNIPVAGIRLLLLHGGVVHAELQVVRFLDLG